MNAFELAQTNVFKFAPVVRKDERRVVLTQRRIIRMLHPIFATADHANNQGVRTVQKRTDLIERHAAKRAPLRRWGKSPITIRRPPIPRLASRGGGGFCYWAFCLK